MVGLLIAEQLSSPEAKTGGIWQTLYILFMFGLVVFLAVIVTRLWAKRGAGIATGPKRHLSLLEYVPLGGVGKGLCLVKAVDAVLLISISDQEIKIIKEYPFTSEFADMPSGRNMPALPDWLTKLLPDRKTADQAVESNANDPGPRQDFAAELRARLDKLKEPKA